MRVKCSQRWRWPLPAAPPRSCRRRHWHWSSGPPAVGLLTEFQVHEGLGAGDARHAAYPAEDLEQVVVVLADHLDEDVEGARGDHHVVDLVHVREMVGDPLEVA